VFVKTATGYDRREIKLGLYNEKMVEIREGLEEGDQVVMNPKVLLAPDDKTRTRDDGGKNSGKDGGKGGGKDGGGDGSGAPKGDGKTGPGGGGGKKKGAGGGPPPGL
jgi:HlyD family secretion protein